MVQKTRLRKVAVLAVCLLTLSILLYIQNQQKTQNKIAKANTLVSNTRKTSKLLDQFVDEDRVVRIILERPVPQGLENRTNGNQSDAVKDVSWLELQRNVESSSGRRWSLVFPAGIPVRPGALPNLAMSALKLRGEELRSDFDLKEPLAKARYGFEEPVVSIDYFGEKLLGRILIGAEVPGVGGYYAVAISGAGIASKTLFRLSGIEGLSTDANALRKQALSQLVWNGERGERLELLELRSEDSELRVEYKNKALTEQYPQISELQSFIMSKPYPGAWGVDLYQLEQLLKQVPNPIRILEYIEDRPTDLAIYGLEPEQRQEIYIADSSGNEVALLLGREADAESVYAMEQGSQSVFRLGKAVLAPLDFEPFRIVDKFVMLINIAEAEEVRFATSSGLSYQMEIQHVSVPKNTGQSDETPKEEVLGGSLSSSLNPEGRSLDVDVSKGLYQEFLSLFFAGEVSLNLEFTEEPQIDMVYLLRSGQERRIRFYDYAATDFYAVSVDGQAPIFLVEKRKLRELEKVLLQVLRTGELNIVN